MSCCCCLPSLRNRCLLWGRGSCRRKNIYIFEEDVLRLLRYIFDRTGEEDLLCKYEEAKDHHHFIVNPLYLPLPEIPRNPPEIPPKKKINMLFVDRWIPPFFLTCCEQRVRLLHKMMKRRYDMMIMHEWSKIREERNGTLLGGPWSRIAAQEFREMASRIFKYDGMEMWEFRLFYFLHAHNTSSTHTQGRQAHMMMHFPPRNMPEFHISRSFLPSFLFCP